MPVCSFTIAEVVEPLVYLFVGACFGIGLWAACCVYTLLLREEDALRQYSQRSKQYQERIEAQDGSTKDVDERKKQCKESEIRILRSFPELAADSSTSLYDEKCTCVVQQLRNMLLCPKTVSLPSLCGDFAALNAEKLGSRSSVLVLKLLPNAILVSGICGTLWEVSSKLASGKELLLRDLGGAVSPGMWAVSAYIILLFIRACLQCRVDSLLKRLNSLTMSYFLPLLLEPSAAEQELARARKLLAVCIRKQKNAESPMLPIVDWGRFDMSLRRFSQFNEKLKEAFAYLSEAHLFYVQETAALLKEWQQALRVLRASCVVCSSGRNAARLDFAYMGDTHEAISRAFAVAHEAAQRSRYMRRDVKKTAACLQRMETVQLLCEAVNALRESFGEKLSMMEHAFRGIEELRRRRSDADMDVQAAVLQLTGVSRSMAQVCTRCEAHQQAYYNNKSIEWVHELAAQLEWAGDVMRAALSDVKRFGLAMQPLNELTRPLHALKRRLLLCGAAVVAFCLLGGIVGWVLVPGEHDASPAKTRLVPSPAKRGANSRTGRSGRKKTKSSRLTRSELFPKPQLTGSSAESFFSDKPLPCVEYRGSGEEGILLPLGRYSLSDTTQDSSILQLWDTAASRDDSADDDSALSF